MRKPNYRFERAERDRMKKARKEEKARRQQERASPQKAVETGYSDPALTTGNGASPDRKVEPD